jgi:two-component system, LytTR family, response regulator
MIKAIIIDDIEHARNTLKKDLATYAPEIEIIAEATGVIDGAKLLKKVKPDILFLDIQMQDGSGFDLLDILPKIDFKIIFITASDAFGIRAFKYSAIDYLLKPIDPDELVKAIEKCKSTAVNESVKYELLKENLQHQDKPHTKLIINTQEKIFLVDFADIIRCESSENYTLFFLKNNKKLLASQTLKNYEDILSVQNFLRVHQSHLINANYVKEFNKTESEILMIDDSRIPVSTRKKADVIKFLESL